MIKKIVKVLSIISLILLLVIFYLSAFGIKTTKFNNQIKNKILETNKGINLDLKAIKITLSPLDLKVSIITLDTKILFNNKKIELENLKTKISLLELFKNQFSINNLQITSRSIKAKNLVSFVRFLENDPKLFLLEMMIKDGYLAGSINLNFDKNGKVKNDFKIDGFVKNLEIKTLKNYKLDNLNFIFDIKDKDYKFLEIEALLNKIKLNSPSITVREKNNSFFIDGKILNNEKNISFKVIDDLITSYYSDLNLKDIHFVSDNDFSFEVSKKFKLSNLNINSEINLSKLTYRNNLESIQKYFPEIKELIKLKDHKIKLNYNKDKTKITGSGKILVEDSEDKISYEIIKKNNRYYFEKVFEVSQNILINELQYRKKKNKKASIKIDGILNSNKSIFFNEISLIENDNSIFIKDLDLDNQFKISDIGLLKLDYKNYNKIYNQVYLKKNKNYYILEGNSFDASKIIDQIMEAKDDDSSIFSNLNSKINLKIKKTYIDDLYFINNLTGKINYKDNEISNLHIESVFPNNKKLKLSIKTNKKNEKITTFFTGYPKPLVRRYKFIKGFDEGYLDFHSIKKDGASNSLLIIDNFKVKEVPIFAKLLSLASLQGIADLLTGEGIRFTDFEMKFANKKGLMTIEEMYAIGPAVSILMDGYIETKQLVSLRGTLVPATTINRSIASIPLLGKILIGDKTGEGVFGVSFKIKGAPKNLKTSVNPIKTLTPRFITRTLEKIKKD
ncbi:hypothetical protein N9I08_04030 [Candidatus Pelagibacter sp.]|jgi:hypothetical protein|nr:hypothetical protein [Candidatus Pelagibacter sp.]